MHVLADVLANDLPLEPIFEAFVAEFARHAKNNKNWTKIASETLAGSFEGVLVDRPSPTLTNAH